GGGTTVDAVASKLSTGSPGVGSLSRNITKIFMKFGRTVIGNLSSTQSNSDETSVNLHPHPPRGFATKIAEPNRTTTIAAHAALAAKAKTEARCATHRDIELAKIKLAQTRLESDAKIRAAELESNAKDKVSVLLEGVKARLYTYMVTNSPISVRVWPSKRVLMKSGLKHFHVDIDFVKVAESGEGY
ncbi:hypothetical protein BDK51DRAFT_34873, partial [Blyttiomyces helicus]